MTVQSGAAHALAYVAESTYGTTPGTPEMVALRHTSCDIPLARDTMASEEARSDYEVSEARSLADKVNGSIGFELSYGEYDPLFAAVMRGSWATNVLKNGVLRPSFTFEEQLLDISKYAVATGMMLDGMSLSLKANSIITGSFSLVGSGKTYGTTPLDATITASQDNAPMDAFSGVMKAGGTEVSVITGIDLNIANGLSANFVLGRKTAHSQNYSKRKVTGKLTALFEDLTLLDLFLADAYSSVEVTMGNGTAKSYKLLLPKVKYTSGGHPQQGDGPIILNMDFQAVVDTTTGTSVQLTRIP